MAEDKVKALYDTFVKEGYDMESEADFRKNLADPAKRKAAYNALKNDGYDMEAYEAFETNIGFGKQTAVGTPTPPSAAAAPQAAALQQEAPAHIDGQPSKPAWRPSMQDKIRMQYNVGSVLSDFNKRSKARVEQSRRALNRYTPEGRQEQKVGEFQAQIAGKPTKTLGMTPGDARTFNEGTPSDTDSMEAGNPSLFDGRGPVAHGVVMEDGKQKTQWMLPDGTLTTDLAEADAAEYNARRVRLRSQFVGRMKKNGLDPSKREDVERQALLDYEAPVRKAVAAAIAADDARDQEEQEAYMSNPANMVGGVNAALGHAALRNRDGIGDLTKIAEDAYDSLPQSYRKELVDSYTDYFTQNPDATDGKTIDQAARDAAKSVVYGHVHEEYVKRNMPQSKNEFFLRKITELNPASVALSSTAIPRGQAYADLDAMERYGAQHKGLDIAGTVAGMAIDPATYLGGWVGNAAFKHAAKAVGKKMAKEAMGEVAGRYAATTLAGRIIGGMAAGGVNFGSFEAVKDAERQLYQGGYMNPGTGEMEGFSFGSVLSSGVHGIGMGAATGAVSPLIGNVADKAVKAISSTAGKVAMRGGEQIISTLAEGTVFSIPEWISGDQDAFDVWTDNMAMMAGFKVSHGIKTAPAMIRSLRPAKPRGDRPLTRDERIHNNKSFNERLRERMDGQPDMALTAEEREELKRRGYGELSDLFARDRKEVREVKPDGAEQRIGDLERGIYFDNSGLVRHGETAGGKDFEAVKGDFDGYEAMEQLMEDGSVSEATRAKAYYILTWRNLPMSTVTGWNQERNDDGSITVSSLSHDGGTVTARTFKTEKEAQREIDRINRQVELNTIDIGEQYRQAEADFYHRESARPDVIREQISKETGIDIDKAIRKEPEKRSEKETEAVKKYVRALFPEEEAGEARAGSEPYEPTPEQQEADRIYDEGRLLFGRLEQRDPDAQAEMDAISTRMEDAHRMIEDAFGDESEAFMAQISEDPRSVLTNPTLLEEQREAVVNYINVRSALEGVLDASNEAAADRKAAVEREVRHRTHMESGMVIPAVMKEGDEQVYVVKGDVAMMPDGSGVDVAGTLERNQSGAIYILDSAGEIRSVSPDQILSVGHSVDPHIELQEAYDNIDREQESIIPQPAEALQSESKSPEFGENITQTEPKPTENPVPEAKVAPETALPVESIQKAATEAEMQPAVESDEESETSGAPQTALKRIPKDEAGTPLFEKAPDPETGWDALVEDSDDEEEAAGYAEGMVRHLAGEVEKARKKLTGVKVTGDRVKYKADRNAAKEHLAAVGKSLEAWKGIAGVHAGRIAARQAEAEAQRAAAEEEARRAAAEAEARRRLEKEEEAAWKTRKGKLDRRVRDTAETVRDIPDAVALLEDMEPKDIYELAALTLQDARLLADDPKMKGFAQEMGSNQKNERRRFFGLFASREKGGLSLQHLAESMTAQMEQLGIPGDSQDARNALLEILQQSQTRGDFYSYIPEARIRQAMDMYEAEREMSEQERREYEDWQHRERYGYGLDEREAYEEMRMAMLGDLDRNFDESEFYANFADELISRLNNGRREEGAAVRGVEEGAGELQGTRSQGEGELSGVGDEILPAEGALQQGGAREDGSGAGLPEGAGAGGSLAEDGLSGPSSGGGIESVEADAGEGAPKASLFQYFSGSLSDLISRAKEGAAGLVKKLISPVSGRLRHDLADRGLDVGEDYNHVLDNNAIRHTLKQHGSGKEESRGQIPVTEEDFAKIKEIVEEYDDVRVEPGKTAAPRIIYSKSYPDGSTIFVEEQRKGRKELAAVTMWKQNKTALTGAKSEDAPQIPDSDGNGSKSERKPIIDKQTAEAESSASYTITAGKYTNKKGKTSDVWIVKFDRDLSKEEKTALDTYTREPLAEGKKTSRGWYDRKEGGYMMRSEEAAKALAGMIGNEEAVADAQPLTAEDYAEGVKSEERIAESGWKKPQSMNRVGVDGLFNDLNTKGENKLGDHAEPVSPVDKPADAPKESEPKGFKVDDEMRSMEDQLRALLGIGDDEGDRGDLFRNPEDFTTAEKIRILSVGTTYALKYFDQGMTHFPDFADRMVRRLGEQIRPWLKSFYGGARDVPGYGHLEFTPAEEVKAFDVMNFDRAEKDRHADPIRTAQETVAERRAEAAADEARREIKKQRNQRRKEAEKSGQEEAYHGTVTLKDGREAVVIAANHTQNIGEPARLTGYIVGVKGEPGTIKISPEEIKHGGAPTREDRRETEPEAQTPGQTETSESPGGRPASRDTEAALEKAGELLRGGKKPTKRTKEIKPGQQAGDLFGGLLDKEPTTDEKESYIRPGAGYAGGEGKGHEPRQDKPLGAGERNEDEHADGGGVAGRGAGDTVPDAGRGDGVSTVPGEHAVGTISPGDRPASRPNGAEPLKRLPAGERRNIRNNRAERGKDYAPKGVDARIRANIKAIELAQELLESGATATPGQMAILRQFSGWGGLGKAFNDDGYSMRIKKLLGQDYQGAVDSRNSAYYTPAYIIDSMWDIASALGFKGGNVLEGSAGIGNILGLMPAEMRDRSSIHAVEVDPTTGGILGLLYPDAKVDIQGFEATKIPNGSVDLSITNVPFITGWNVADTSGDKDLSRKFRDIHDFCIAKNVRKLKPGGIGIFITSSGTLDNSDKLRAWLTNEGGADAVGAFRMNKETFGGTGATSDIIVVRKRVNGQKSPYAIDVSDVTGVRVVEYGEGDEKKSYPMRYNKYFFEHPENMAGEMLFNFENGETFQPTSRALFPAAGKDQASMLKEWASRFAKMDFETAPEKESFTPTYDKVGNEVKTGTMVVDGQGRLCTNMNGTAVPLKGSAPTGYGKLTPEEKKKVDADRESRFNTNKIKGRTRQQCLSDYNEVKKALADVLKYQTEHTDNEGLDPLLIKLNDAFDKFVRLYGNLHKNPKLAWLRNDVDYPSVLALESFEERANAQGERTRKYGKTDIFMQRVVEKEAEPKPENVKDGIIASIYKNGRVDLPYIADALGKPEGEVKKEIIRAGLGYENPNTGEVEVSYEYLSGNVREKLRQAQDNNDDGRFTPNIKALEKVIPMNIPAHLIEFTLGSTWVSPKLYEDFIKEKTGVSVRLKNAGGTWFMGLPESGTEGEQNRAQGVYSKDLDRTVWGHQLMEAAITNRSITVSRTYKHRDGSSETVTDKEATQACAAKIDDIRQEFKDWARKKMREDAEMSEEMERVYNERFNNHVARDIPEEFIPEHFGGAAHVVNGRPFQLRTHQAKAVIRGTMQSQLLAHEVGTGKTYTLISTAMEMRRLGTARKPMIVVQNATVGQFVESAKSLYPNARILTIEEGDRTVEGRKNFYAKIKYNDWDMIVVPQSVFEKIPDSEERQIKFIQDKIEEKLKVLEDMKEADPDGSSIIVRQAEKDLENSRMELSDITQQLEQKRNKRKERDEKRESKTRQNAKVKAMEMLDRETDDVENFDEMGIDAILVDEAHEYKHLGFATAMQRGVKGVDPSFSKKSQGVYLKSLAVKERSNGRNVIFATGTPISNTAAEIWTFMRYLMDADTMKEYGIYYFDDFVRNFGSLQQMLEFTTSGKFKENNRFAGYVNLPELVRIWSGVADTVLTRDAGGVSDKIPKMAGGKAQDIYLPQTKALRSVMIYAKSELERFEKMTGKEKKQNSHIPLRMFGIAKAAAIDPRLVLENAEDEPNSKTNEAVRQTLQSLKDTESYKGTVAIFADNYQNKESGFNLYEEIKRKLVESGVPADQIAIMKSGISDKKKLETFEKVNRGEIRVILGSTFTLGTGVNIQERLHTLIHMDAPQRPMDYTQRNGRILRQGNIHKDMGLPVKVIRFGVEDSLDVTAYQRLKTKGAIADSIMNGKNLISNSMEMRSMEEDSDVFGDTVAQLSGSEYAMLKNQAEKEVRKYSSKLKQWETHQMHIHNQLPRLKGQIKGAEERSAEAQKALEVLGSDRDRTITIGGTAYPDMDSMRDLFTEHNKKVMAAQDNAKAGKGVANMSMQVNVGGIDFTIDTVVRRKIENNGQLSFESEREMTYSCPALGLEKVPVSGSRLKAAIEDIVGNVMTGDLFRERKETADGSIERMNKEVAQLESQKGKPFEFVKELEEAETRLDEYTEKMKAELAEKEAKYADLDSTVEAAKDIYMPEDEDEEEDNTASEPMRGYAIQRSLFDEEDFRPAARMKSEPAETPAEREAAKRAETANEAIDDYSDEYAGICRAYAPLIERALKEGNRSLAEGLEERMLSEMENAGAELEMRLTDYYLEEGNSDKDSARMARDMAARVRADIRIRGRLETPSASASARYERPATPEDKPADAKRETSVTAGGDRIEYSSLSKESGEPGLPKLKEGEFTLVERIFTETGEFGFTGNERVETTDDVAYIFRSLENYAVENTFAMLVKEGRPLIVHTGMGTAVMSTMDMLAVKGAFDAYGADAIYIVHNHPSGNMKASPQDAALLRTAQGMFAPGIVKEGVIIDVTSGRYCTFDASGRATEIQRAESGESRAEREYRAKRFDRKNPALKEAYATTEPTIIMASGDVAKFVAEKRLGRKGKISFLLLSQRNQITGNFITDFESYEGHTEELAEQMAVMATRYGARSVIPYGNAKLNIMTMRRLRDEVTTRSGKSVNLLDALSIENGLAGRFTSAADSGMMEATEAYGAPFKSGERRAEGEAAERRKGRELSRLVTEGKSLDFLNEGGMRTAFRYAQFVPGGLTKYGTGYVREGVRPPMTAIDSETQDWRAPMEFGEWEQSREGMMKPNGKADLVQGNGRTTGNVAYNPYFHIRVHPLNDQFSAAYDRPELVVVEGDYPESELTSGYRAEGAKNAVGLTDWHAGSVNGQLPEGKKVQTVLSRYFKPRRIVPWGEVAERIMEHIDGADVTFPLNVVPPRLRAELSKLGARFEGISGTVGREQREQLEETERQLALGNHNYGAEGGLSDSDIARYNLRIGKLSSTDPRRMEGAVTLLSDRLNTPIRLISRAEAEAEGYGRKKGWYDRSTGRITIVADNHRNVGDITDTAIHEAVGHNGLRQLFGTETQLNNFLDEAYNASSDRIRAEIDRRTERMLDAETERNRERLRKEHEEAGENADSEYYADMAKARIEAETRREQTRRDATEEYAADLGMKIGEEGFERMDAEELTFWGKIKGMLQNALDRLLAGLKLPKMRKWTDKEWSYVMWRSWRNLRESGRAGVGNGFAAGGFLAEAEDIAKRGSLNYGADERRLFRDSDMGLDEAITKMKADAATANGADLAAKQAAMRAIGGNLSKLRQAMARQRDYDISTVKSMTDLAKTMLDAGLLDDLSKLETKRILAAVKGAVGKQDTSRQVQKLMDIMVDNQLRMGADRYGRMLTVKATRTDARGIEKQGQLDPDGQRIVEAVRHASGRSAADIDALMAEASNRMGSADRTVADAAALEYGGLLIARRYAEDIRESKTEEKDLRASIKESEEEYKQGRITHSAYLQYKAATEDAIRQNKIDRAEAYGSLCEQLGGVLGESIERARQWRDAEKQRVEEIHHNANSDMEGRPNDEHHKETRLQKLANNGAVRFLLAPLATFDQMLRMFGSKSVRGEGYLWNRYMRGWVDCTEKEYTGYQNALKELDEKVSDVFGKEMKWGDLFGMERRMPKAAVSFRDGDGIKEHQLTQGNLLYIYMADKMSDGRMKLRRMGITEDDVDDIKDRLDPRFIELADWMQEEFLPGKRDGYNEVHRRMFGASMASIDNYFPLKILANARAEAVDLAEDANADTALPATSTGSIIKRRRNALALDVTGADAFSVILDHIQQMERWAAFAEYNRDLNTLLSYKRFRNQVMNMTSAYGAGKTLWRNFRNAASMAAGAYRPPTAPLDKSAVNIAKGVTAAKVSFRVFTALKQFLSAPAYLTDSNPLYLAANIANPAGAWKWSMENLPLFEKRWKSRTAGDPRLMKSEMDWKMWRSRIVEIAGRIGMSPNAFVDALTVAIGARSMYQTKLDKYRRYGYEEDEAQKRAKQDATILFNQTQQSSEGAFLSTMQADRSWLSVLFTVFRNSSMSYTRQLYDALRNIGHRLKPGYKGITEEFMAKQMMRDGIDPDQADGNARREYRNGIVRDLARVAVFGAALQMAWNLGAYLPYLIFGRNDDEKDKMWDDVMTHTMFGSIEGLTGGDVMSAAGNMWLSGEGDPKNLAKDMPLASDIMNVRKKMDKDYVAAANDVVNLLVQSGLGANPQSLTDAVAAVIDYSNGDMTEAREIALCMMRILNCPQSQMDKIYFDEIDMTAEEAAEVMKHSPAGIAERYAEYKTLRNAPLTGWAYSGEGRDAQMEKHRKRAKTAMKERVSSRMLDSLTREIIAEGDAAAAREKELHKLLQSRRPEDREAYRQGMKELRDTTDLARMRRVKRYTQIINQLTRRWLDARTAPEADSIARAIADTRQLLLDEDSQYRKAE